jgi:L-fuconolactonase
MMRVDAHHHVWVVARGDYEWLTPDLPICRDYSLDDLRPLLGDIRATVVVQAAPSEAETRFLLDVAHASNGLVRGVVGWIDFTAPEAMDRVAALVRDPLLKGLRPMLQDLSDRDWLLRPDVQPALRSMALHGVRFDALIQPRHLAIMPEVAARHPELAMVIDHGAKPAIARRAFQPWAELIAAVARETAVYCKISGLITEAASNWRVEDLRPYVDHLISSFGPMRLMWGSDWPVVELAGGYERWRDATDVLLKDLSAAERDSILGTTASSFYQIDMLE